MINTIHSARRTSRYIGRASALLGCLFLAGLLAACSSVKSRIDKAPVRARSFSFLNTGNRQPPSFTETSAQAHTLVQQAIANTMASKGVSYTPTGGEVTVGYLIVVGNNSTTTSLNTYFGYTEDTQAFLEKVHSEQTGSHARTYFEAGTLVIDFVEPTSSQLLQRRSIKAEVLRNLALEARAERVQKLVDQALADVQIQH